MKNVCRVLHEDLCFVGVHGIQQKHALCVSVPLKMGLARKANTKRPSIVKPDTVERCLCLSIGHGRSLCLCIWCSRSVGLTVCGLGLWLCLGVGYVLRLCMRVCLCLSACLCLYRNLNHSRHDGLGFCSALSVP